MKKTFPIIFSAALICCSFTACGKKEDANSTTESTTMAQDESSGLNSATDASLEDHINDQSSSNAGNANSSVNDNNSDNSNGIVDDLVSTGEDIVSDAGSAIEDVGDAIVGTDKAR